MIYTYSKLIDAVSRIDLDSCDESYKNELSHLLHIWATAYKTAPDYIIGVGLYTYAENALIEYQEQQTQTQNTES